MNGENLKRGVATVLVASTIASGGSNVKAETTDPLRESQLDHYRREFIYREYVNDEDLSLYNEGFVKFYREGKMIINNQEYKVSDLYLEYGLSNDESQLFLVYYCFPQKDLLTAKEKVNFRRSGLMEFRNAYIFYQLYLTFSKDIIDNKLVVSDENYDEILSLVQSFDGSIHIEVPELSYGRVKVK